MSHLARPIIPVMLATVFLVLIAAPTSASVGLVYFEVTQGTNPTDAVVAWSTETETNTVAFVIERGGTADPAQAVTIHITPARGSAISGYDYRYFDTGLTPGRIYYYWLVELTTHGEMVTLGIRQITAGGTLPTEPRAFMPLAPISATSSVGHGR